MRRVYVEANFVLDLAYERDADSQRLLDLARKGRAILAIPYSALWESHPALARERGQLREFADKCRETSKKLGGTEQATEAAQALVTAAARLEAFVHSIDACLAEAHGLLLSIAEVIPLTPNLLCDARMLEFKHDLEERDAMVLAAVVGHAASSPAPWCCFYTKDREHFEKDSVVQCLKWNGVHEIYFRPGDVVGAVLRQEGDYR